MRRMLTIVAALAAPTLCPEAGFAQQGSITGTVTDGAGVLPGVTIEASRPGLEGPRVTYTDDVGSYSLVDLPAGVWTLTFELPGFSTASRSRELQGDSIDTVDVELTVAGRIDGTTVNAPRPSYGFHIEPVVLVGPPPHPVPTRRSVGVTITSPFGYGGVPGSPVRPRQGVTITNTIGYGGVPVPPVWPRQGVTVTNNSTGGLLPAAPGDQPGRSVTIQP